MKKRPGWHERAQHTGVFCTGCGAERDMCGQTAHRPECPVLKETPMVYEYEPIEPIEALRKLSFLKEHLKDGVEIAVFRDNRWGDDPVSKSTYYIIIHGNGQVPYGELSEECFRHLLRDGYLEHNTLTTYKDRGYHRYLGPAGIGFPGWKYVPLKELTK